LNNPEQQHNEEKTQPNTTESNQSKQLKRTLRKETQNTTPTKRIKLIPNEPNNQQINQQKTTKQQKTQQYTKPHNATNKKPKQQCIKHTTKTAHSYKFPENEPEPDITKNEHSRNYTKNLCRIPTRRNKKRSIQKRIP